MALLVLWTLVAAAVWGLDRSKPSPERILRFIQQQPLGAELSSAERSRWITELARQINELAGEDRLRLFLDPELQRTVALLTDREKSRYLELTVAKGIPEMLEGFRNATSDRRLRWIDTALADLEQLRAGSRDSLEKTLDRHAMDRIAREGLTPFLETSGVTVQVQLQPVLERIQTVVQVTR